MKQRTKEQKMHAQEKRKQLYSYQFRSENQQQSVLATNARTSAMDNLFAYDTNLIYKDLQKTILITLLIIGCLVAIYMYSPLR